MLRDWITATGAALHIKGEGTEINVAAVEGGSCCTNQVNLYGENTHKKSNTIKVSYESGISNETRLSCSHYVPDVPPPLAYLE